MAVQPLRIGTRDSQLALWQATLVQNLLKARHIPTELVLIKSEGDLDTVTPLYELGVQGVFTKTLDAALLAGRIDLAVHSMKDVPIQLAKGITQAAVLKRGSHKDIFIYKSEADLETIGYKEGEWHHKSVQTPYTIATSSIRRMAQWLHRYPGHRIENLRGNVNTRLRKLAESNWNGAVFAAAGVERINLRPENSIDLDWMLPAPAQGAIMVVARTGDEQTYQSCQSMNDASTARCTKIERDFLRTLLGGCSTPISAWAVEKDGYILLKGNIISPDGLAKADIEKTSTIEEASDIGIKAAKELLASGGQAIVDRMRKSDLLHGKV